MRKIVLLMVALACGWAAPAHGDVRLPAILGDNMVLQADKEVAVWGWAAPGEKVTVSLLGKQKETTAGPDRTWRVKLDPAKAGGPVELTVAGANTLTLRNVLIGEVWVCSGQSNMGYKFARAHNASVEGPKADNASIRLFTVKRKTAFEPQADCEGQWVVCTPETVKAFSAVGYFFGRDVQKASLGVPVGLIDTSWGGTPAQAWTAIRGLAGHSSLEEYAETFLSTKENLLALTEKYRSEALPRYEAALKQWEETDGAAHRQALAAWRKEAAAARAAGKPEPAEPKPAKAPPRKPAPPGDNPNLPTVLNNGMVAPLVPLSIRGAIWYQGESNVGNVPHYRALFPVLIKDWRRQFDQGDFPFVWVQLANYMAREPGPTQTGNGWAGLREAQSMALALPNTAQAVAIDVGEADDIHPKNKDVVGRRLALGALKVAYGRDVVHSGPTYAGLSVEGSRARVTFANVGGGLTIGAAPALRLDQAPPKPGEKLVGFAIAGEDRKFVWANATIEGDTVVVSAEGVREPVAVWYAWGNNPACNLYNREGLPAGPFRTDRWESGVGKRD